MPDATHPGQPVGATFLAILGGQLYQSIGKSRPSDFIAQLPLSAQSGHPKSVSTMQYTKPVVSSGVQP